MYLDSAIIVKLLVREADSAWFNRAVSGQELWSSELALAEVPSAILIKERTGQISVAQRRAALARFQAMRDAETIRLLPLNSAIVEHAANLVVSCHPEIGLRSLDALHVATAILYPRGPICATDGRMRAAAKRVGAPCFPEDLAEIETA